jgi:DNA-binding NarL/FixJ family response regulator
LISVLIVDDHELLRAGLRSRLEREDGISVVGEADSAERAVIVARAVQPDLILLDLLLPRKSGDDAIPDLANVAPQARVLVVSSQAAPSSVRRALSAGAAGYLPKRSSDRELVAAIRLVADGAGYVEPDLGAQLVVPNGSPALEPLSDRERDILHLLALGYTNQEIGKKLFISVRTVDTHRAHIMRKLKLETRAELVMFALANGVIGPERRLRDRPGGRWRSFLAHSRIGRRIHCKRSANSPMSRGQCSLHDPTMDGRIDPMVALRQATSPTCTCSPKLAA